MKYTIGNRTIRVPETKVNSRTRTPRQVVPWRDVAETCRTLDAVCEHIPLKGKITIADGIARSGFWGAVFQNHWPDCKLVLNEEETSCNDTLKLNFPEAVLSNHDIHKWAPEAVDISLLDFDHFTLRILDQWKDVLIKWSPVSRYFIIADGACFGFKFGNMKHYGIKNANDYYYLLDEAMKKFIDKRITVVSSFINASTILLEDKKPKEIKFLPPSELYLSRGDVIYKNKKPEPLKGILY